MKRNRLKSMLMAGLAAVSFTAPLAFAGAASADPYGYNQSHRGDYRDGYRDGRRADDRWDRRDERRSYRNGYRDGRHDWRRGERATFRERAYWRDVDYRYYRWNPPPRGYHYVHDRRTGDYLLVGIATGVILGVIASQ